MRSVRAEQAFLLHFVLLNIFLSLAFFSSCGRISDFLILFCDLLFNLILHLDRRSYLTQTLHQLIIVPLFTY